MNPLPSSAPSPSPASPSTTLTPLNSSAASPACPPFANASNRSSPAKPSPPSTKTRPTSPLAPSRSSGTLPQPTPVTTPSSSSSPRQCHPVHQGPLPLPQGPVRRRGRLCRPHRAPGHHQPLGRQVYSQNRPAQPQKRFYLRQAQDQTQTSTTSSPLSLPTSRRSKSARTPQRRPTPAVPSPRDRPGRLNPPSHPPIPFSIAAGVPVPSPILSVSSRLPRASQLSFLAGQTKCTLHLSPIKVIQAPDGSLNRAALAGALAKERRELRQQEQNDEADERRTLRLGI